MYCDKSTGNLVYSPSDLIRFMESPFASWMDRYHLENPGKLTPDADTEEQKLVQETGNQHEHKFVSRLKAEGRDFVEIARRTPDPEAATRAAMAAGREVIYQACLSLAPFRGHADFLMRTDVQVEGRAVYEVWDTKLARKTKPYYLVQLCCYAEMLEHAQGVRPRTLRVVLGNNEIPAYATEDFFYYYLQLKDAFLAQMAGFRPDSPPVPEARADHGRWQSHAERKLLEIDHLSQVARISAGQIKKLNAVGIATVAQLAKAKTTRLAGLTQPIADRLVEQARLQVATNALRKKAPAGTLVPPLFRVIPADPDHPRQGLALLPPPNPNDLFFDMEGFPLVEGGLEYLFGVTFRKKGRLNFIDWWAHDATEEKKAFEGFIDWAYARWRKNSSLHIYHYAQYEVSALRRLMGRHGTREDELDELLRNGVFVDLYKITQQGLRIGEPSYSIKYVEHLYRGQRSGDVKAAGESIVYYANWIESGQGRDWRKAPILEKIRDYNRDDCDSTCQLYDWLQSEQKKSGIAYLPPAEAKPAAEPDPEQAAAADPQQLLSRLHSRGLDADSDGKLRNAIILLCQNRWSAHSIVSVEEPFFIDLASGLPPVIGVADLILRDGNKALVVDHKTSARFNELSSDQLVLYAEHARRTHEVRRVDGWYDEYRLVTNLATIRKPAFRRTPVVVGRTLLPPLIQRYREAWQEIVTLSKESEPAPAYDCWRCNSAWWYR